MAILAIQPRTVKSEAPDADPALAPPVPELMTADEALAVLEQALQPKHLSDLQLLVFCRSWLGQSYEEIAGELRYDDSYIREIGSQLWNELTKALGEKVTKKNVQSALRRYQQKLNSRSHPTESPLVGLGVTPPVGAASSTLEDAIGAASANALEFPSGTVALGSRFYVARPPIEEQVFAEVSKPGSLIRIKAPRQMGKSSLMHRIVAYARQCGFQTAMLNLQRADSAVFRSLDPFLRWLCTNISQQLDLMPNLEQYWNQDAGSKMSCTLYFQRYLLKSIDTALVLALDEVNRLFEYPELAADFLPLLRSWYEDASEFEVWQKLRLVVVHATEVYIPLNIHQSPFNVGLPIKLPELNTAQVQNLALRHGLTWAEGDIGRHCLQPLLDLIGGHPYLVRLAFYHLGRRDLTLEQLLQDAATPAGIYGEHLRQHLTHLQERPALALALGQVLHDQTIHLEPVTVYQLESLGLVKLQGDRVAPSRELYRLYFQQQLLNH